MPLPGMQAGDQRCQRPLQHQRRLRLHARGVGEAGFGAAHVAAHHRVPQRATGLESRLLSRRQRLRLADESAAEFFLGFVDRPAQQLEDVEAFDGFERRPASGACRVVAGVDAIHYYVAGGKPFKQIAPTDLRLLRREQEEIATFGRVATHRDENFSEQHGFAAEEWQVVEDWHMVNASSAGLRIARPLAQSGAAQRNRLRSEPSSSAARWKSSPDSRARFA